MTCTHEDKCFFWLSSDPKISLSACYQVRPAVVAAREQNDNLSSIVRDFWMTDGSLEELKAYAGEVADNLDADVEIAINMINDEAVSWKISSLRQQLLHKHGQITELQRTHQAMVSKAASSANAAARQLALAKARGRQLGIEQQQYQAALQKSAEEAEADIAVRRLVATVFDNIVQQAASERARSLTAGAMQFAAKAGASMAARGLQSVQAALAGAAQIDQQIHVLCKEEQLNKYYVMADHGPVAGQLKVCNICLRKGICVVMLHHHRLHAEVYLW